MDCDAAVLTALMRVMKGSPGDIRTQTRRVLWIRNALSIVPVPSEVTGDVCGALYDEASFVISFNDEKEG